MTGADEGAEHPEGTGRPTAGRRAFFKLFAAECFALVEEFRGRPQLRLGDLADLPDERLGAIMPMIGDGWEILLGETRVCARERDGDREVTLFERTAPDIFAYNRFNGRNEIEEIARLLAEEMGWDEQRAFGHVRALFLSMLEQGVAVPANPVW